MIDLANDLTLTFVWIIHNFELKNIELKFRVLPTVGTTVATGLDDWKEINIGYQDPSAAYNVIIGKSKDEIWSLITIEYGKYTTYLSGYSQWVIDHDQWVIDHAQWEIDVNQTPSLEEPVDPIMPTPTHSDELTKLFEYVIEVGIK